MSREAYYWSVVLDDFKASETEAALLFVIEDAWLREAEAARHVMPGVEPPDAATRVANAWDALWKEAQFDLVVYADLLDTFHGHARQLFERARALKLIYPDGTVHRGALRLIQERVTDASKKAEEEED